MLFETLKNENSRPIHGHGYFYHSASPYKSSSDSCPWIICLTRRKLPILRLLSRMRIFSARISRFNSTILAALNRSTYTRPRSSRTLLMARSPESNTRLSRNRICCFLSRSTASRISISSNSPTDRAMSRASSMLTRPLARHSSIKRLFTSLVATASVLHTHG